MENSISQENRSNSIILRTFAEIIRHVLNDIQIYYLLILYLVFGYSYLFATGQFSSSYLFMYFDNLFILIGILLPILSIIYSALNVPVKLSGRYLLAYRMLMRPTNLANMLSTIILMSFICLHIGMFTSIKTSLSTLLGFQHDIWQANLDKYLLFGHEPWQLLIKPFHSEALLSIIEINYNMIWHLQTYIILFFVCLSNKNQNLRKRYIVCFMMIWFVVGNLFAGLFISAGPAFYGNVTGDTLRFGEQMAMLAGSSVVDLQSYLWTAYETKSTAFGTGISAFPSVHVSVTVLNAFFAFEVNRKLGLLATGYALFVGYSSVYLAWHYAVDGIFGALLVGLLYYITKRIWPTKNASEAARINSKQQLAYL